MGWRKKALRDEILARFPLNYKRYIEVFGGAGWVLFHKPPGNDFEAVSYTHLDVYKRQLQGTGNQIYHRAEFHRPDQGRGDGQTGGKQTVAGQNHIRAVRAEGRNSADAEPSGIRLCAGKRDKNRLHGQPVSYTHLDVYKRQLILFGPFEAQIYRVNEKYRMRMIIKCKMNRRTREFFSELLEEFSNHCGKKVTITIDVNPENL